MKGILKSERGIALFLVLWVMALLTVIEASSAMPSERKQT
jgi:type II secretory pathway component PulK